MTSEARRLNPAERRFIARLIGSATNGRKIVSNLDSYEVLEMADGGMGSLRFQSSRPDAVFGRQIAEIEFKDSDDVPVSVTFNVDDRGEPFELDVFKADFSPLICFPD